MAKRIVIAGGGTGGHIFPAVAVAHALRAKDPSIEILFIGARGKMEMEKVPKAGYRIEGLDIAGFDRGQLWRNYALPYKMVKSFLQVRSIFRRFKPDAAFGVGGYSSFPVLRYAQWKGIPTYLHEANAYGGKSNMLLAKKARIVFTGTRDMERFFPAHKTLFSGNPVRREVVQKGLAKEKAAAVFGLNPNKVTLFAMGGSLGARSINQAIHKGLDKWHKAGYQLVWQTGTSYLSEAKAAAAELEGIYVSDFVWDMNAAYTLADLVISRAGAMSVTELCLTAKPVIFVPFPFAAEDHQTANAMALVKQHAAWMVPDKMASAELMEKAHDLAGDENRRQQMALAIAPLAKPDADVFIAQKIVNDLDR